MQLFADKAPVTVNNFVYLAKDGFFDCTVFHRVINDFMVQAAIPPARAVAAGLQVERQKGALAIPHDRGVLSMANAGPNTSGSQFFITHVKTEWLERQTRRLRQRSRAA